MASKVYLSNPKAWDAQGQIRLKTKTPIKILAAMTLPPLFLLGINLLGKEINNKFRPPWTDQSILPAVDKVSDTSDNQVGSTVTLNP
jgi:hypothetical protein